MALHDMTAHGEPAGVGNSRLTSEPASQQRKRGAAKRLFREVSGKAARMRVFKLVHIHRSKADAVD